MPQVLQEGTLGTPLCPPFHGTPRTQRGPSMQRDVLAPALEGNRTHSSFENNSLRVQIGRNVFRVSLPRKTKWPFCWGPAKSPHSGQHAGLSRGRIWATNLPSRGPQPDLSEGESLNFCIKAPQAPRKSAPGLDWEVLIGQIIKQHELQRCFSWFCVIMHCYNINNYLNVTKTNVSTG